MSGCLQLHYVSLIDVSWVSPKYLVSSPGFLLVSTFLCGWSTPTPKKQVETTVRKVNSPRNCRRPFMEDSDISNAIQNASSYLSLVELFLLLHAVCASQVQSSYQE